MGTFELLQRRGSMSQPLEASMFMPHVRPLVPVPTPLIQTVTSEVPDRLERVSRFGFSFAHIPASSWQDTTSGKGEERALPGSLRSGIEPLSGMSMDDVRVHYNSFKPAQVQALAYTQGTDIHVGPGQEKHLPHEAWHVAQQKQGRVSPTWQAKGVAINDEVGLEREADEMGAKSISETSGSDHSHGCCCSACLRAAKMPGVNGVTPTYTHANNGGGSAPIQGCWLCGDNTCLHGEKCKKDPTIEGLFPKGSDTMDVGRYNEMKPQGSQGGTRQWEHPFSGSTLKQIGKKDYYKTSPVIGIDWDTHQEGRYGTGGGITTTGGSNVAKGWSADKASKIKSGNAKEALRETIVDAVNAAQYNNILSVDWANAYFRVINGYAMDGFITKTEAGELQDFLMTLVLDRLEKKRF